uniref:Reverse transcriptase domain-containing protein n=1 Tax=Tanacetum cinerariifolium TaxID=118510 RepID=A0A6L2MXL4_TANCI|nr:reverse transcriptase domain-containing protein [Tanacetum cinerariifolium]
MFLQPHDLDYVPEPMYSEYIPLEDEHVLSAEEQPLPHVVSPTAKSLEYVLELDPEEDLEEYEDDEIKDGPVDYLIDRGDDGDDDDGDSSGDDDDYEDEDEEDKDEEEEEEEHLAPADFAIVIPTDKLVSPPEGTKPVITPPSTNTTTTGTRITIWLQAAISLLPKTEVERLLAMPTLLPSPLASLSPPSVGEHLARSSSKLARDQTSNPTSSTNPTPKGRIRRSSKQKVENSHFEEHLTPVATMTDNHTMAEMLRAPTEGCVEAIPPILVEQFELKHSLINMMTSEQFFGLEKDNPHDHGQPVGGLKKNPRQKFDESFHVAWERYKDLLRACPHHVFTKLHQLDTFYNALNPADQDSLNAAAGDNLLEKSPQDALTIIENKSKVRNSRSKLIASPVNSYDNHSSFELAKLTHAVNQQTSAMTIVMMAMLKQFQSNPPPAQVKAVEEICVTCGGAHPYYQCLAADGNTFPEYRDNIQGYVSAATGNYNQGNPGYRPQGVANQIRPPGFAQLNVQNNQNRFGQPQGFNCSTNFNQEQPYQATQSNQNFHLNELEKIKRMNDTSLSNQTNEIKHMMASLLQMNTASTSGSGTLPGNTISNPKGKLKAITTRSGLVTEGHTVPNPPKFVNPEDDECVEETYTDPDHTEYNIKVPPPPPKKLGLPDLIRTRMTLELANRAICTPDGIVRDVFVPVGKFTFLADFVVVDYKSDPRVPLILGRPFLRTTHALIDIYDEEMILRDRDERLTINMKHDTASYSNHPYRELVNLINIFNLSSEDCLEVKENQEKDKIRSKPDKNGKRGEAGKSLKQLQ